MFEAERRIARALRDRAAFLDLSRLGLVEIPESISQLIDLTELHLFANQLGSLPESLGRLRQLTSLNLSMNRLVELPDWIGQLDRLRVLRLFDNELTELPEPIGRLDALSQLDLRGNKLTELPESIGQMDSLTWLDVRGNQLNALPAALGRLRLLTALELSGNQNLSSPSPEVVAQGTQAVLAFLRGRAESSIELWRSKILIVGEATVGKTSLAKQLADETFDPAEPLTHGVRIRNLSVAHPDRPEVEMALTMWDFGGQLEYRATQRFYLTDRSLFILVWNSRARWQDGKLTAWLDVIVARAPESPILVVATHGDEHSPATLPEDLRRRYPRIVGIHMVDSQSRSGINELKQAVGHHASALPLMGISWPASWHAAAQTIRALPGLTVTAARAWKHMEAAGLADQDTRQAVARVMHDLGDIVYFADHPDLATRMILRPEWLDARIAQVIDSQAVTDARGVLTRAEQQRLWGDLAGTEDDPELPERLLRMMERFDLAYRTGDVEESPDVALIVERLGHSEPDEVAAVWKQRAADPGIHELGIIYRLASRQAGIPTWFIAREHRYTTGLHWRLGALFHDRDPDTPAWALITDDGREQPTITLRVMGRYPVRFLSVLTEAFDNIITDRYPGLVEQRLVPCLCQHGKNGRCGHAFTLKALIAEATATEPDADHKVRCEESGIKIDASIMLDGLRGTGLIAQLEAIHNDTSAHRRELAAQTSRLTRMDSSLLATLNGIRTLLEDRALAGVHCPSLFSIQTIRRRRWPHRESLTLNLWCEWPSGPHPLADGHGQYAMDRPPQALIRYLPYLRFLITTLGLVAPGLGTAGVHLDERVKSGIEAAVKTLEYIEKIEEQAETATNSTVDALRSSAPSVYQAQTGADFRALRDVLRDLDPDNRKNLGGLSPVARPEDHRIIYLCPHHTRDLDYPYRRATPTP